MVAPSLYGGADDGEVPDDPWATAAREANQSADDDTAEIYARPRRAWRRGEAGETPDGASNGPPTTGNHEQFLPGDRNVREETWEDPAWQSWEGYDGTRNFFSGGPRHWHQWSEGWPRNDWATDGWNSQSSSTTAGYDTAGPALAATTSWTRTSSGATTRRASGDHLRDWQPQGGQQWSQGTTWETRGDEKDRRGGVSEKMSVPVFSAEDQGEKLGSSARSYIRQIEAWTQVTRAPKAQQALLLYQALTGRAWIEAEELQVTELATDEGVEKFKAWITERYQEIEVGKIAEALNGFFKKLRRTPGQSIREFNAAFDRSYARLLEVDCRLPETAKAWAYLNALALSHAEELTILGSVSNEFITARLQRAAVLHEKSLKRPWENRRSWEKDGVPARSPGRPNTAMNTDNREEEPGWAEEAYEADELDDEEAKIFEAYMTAKHQYKDVLRARGLDQEGIKRATDEKIALAKSKSFCSVCKQRGHWHRDPECPMRSSSNDKGGRDRTADKVQTAHAIFETNTNLGETLLAITDCACTKSVMGTSWLQRFVDVLKGMNVEVPLLPEQDNFRFGASRIYTSSYAVVVPLRLGSHWVLIRASVVHGDLPLLVSRGALASLGMVYDLEHHVADFVKIFYEKKISPEVRNMLSGDVLPLESFVKWWQTTKLSADFWIETPEALIRLYVIFLSCMISGNSAREIANHVSSVYGSAVQCSIVESFAHPTHLLCLRPGMSRRPAWQMTKQELLAEATRLGLAPHPDWTAVELRSAIVEMTQDLRTSSVPKGLSSMKLQELKDEADKIGLVYGEKVTRGMLMRNIRDYHATPDNTVMTIGKHRGNTYSQIPGSYARWADAEEKANGANMHPDLRRFVMWHRRQQDPAPSTSVTTLEKMNNPEKYAVVDPTNQRSAAASDQSWDEVKSLTSPGSKGYVKDDRPLGQPSS
ncbi:EIF4E2, partial [Symbiodinium sp. KB8]